MCANGDPNLVRYTGDSFRDLTRIANINDEMWSELLANREAMRDMMKLSSARRKTFNEGEKLI